MFAWEMLVGLGATSNITDERMWEKLKSKRIKCHSYIPETERKLFSYSPDQPLLLKGAFKCEARLDNQMYKYIIGVLTCNTHPKLKTK